ncbi:MAG: DNA recombination protein RmuC [Clostridia bacterium]|nr:DNA recombination protein RmuC [Clostridia bacterium]
MAEWMNANVALLALAAFAALAAIVIIVLKVIEKSILTRLIDAERYRRRQSSELSESVERMSERFIRDSQLMNQMLTVTSRANEERLNELCERVSLSIDRQQRQMAEIREGVDTQLRATLEARLGESFRQVSEQLERVYKSLGEMQALASGVGDLKRVLSGVKTRGVWGEARLQALLEDNLTSAQYLVNTPVEPGSAERVDFAVVLPGKSDGENILLPIDAKFPQEDYQRLIDASIEGNRAQVEKSSLALERAILEQAKSISSKYIKVPNTTDFAILFLPVEGLYAEALRRPGLAQKMQSEYRVLLSGPTTLSALLNSLQMGFRSLAVEKRSEEIWLLLGSMRTELNRFSQALDRARQRIDQAGEELDSASARTKKISRRLASVDSLEDMGSDSSIPENIIN